MPPYCLTRFWPSSRGRVSSRPVKTNESPARQFSSPCGSSFVPAPGGGATFFCWPRKSNFFSSPSPPGGVGGRTVGMESKIACISVFSGSSVFFLAGDFRVVSSSGFLLLLRQRLTCVSYQQMRLPCRSLLACLSSFLSQLPRLHQRMLDSHRHSGQCSCSPQ